MKHKLPFSLLLLITGSSFLFYAFSTGITGRTLKNGTGCNCHSETPFSNVTVTINGPDTLVVNQTALYSVTISGGPLQRAGTNIAASNGALAINGSDLQLMGDELTHTAPKEPVAGTTTFSFSYTAPSVTGNITLYANGNSVNFNGNNGGDEWNFAPNKTVVVRGAVPVELSSFTAEVSGNNVILKWITSTEKNNIGFEILRSANRETWISAGFVKGTGNSTEINGYSFTDRNLGAGKYYYKLRQSDYNGEESFYELKGEVDIQNPLNFSLMQNYPNPFNPSTKIKFMLKEPGIVNLKVYNLIGESVADLISNEFMEAGVHEITFDTRDIKNLSSGIYIYSLSSGEFKSVKKMVLNK